MILTDRSRTLEAQRCPRARFMRYEWGGYGVEPPTAQIELVTGIATHAGVGARLEGRTLEEAVRACLDGYTEAMEGRTPEEPDDVWLRTQAEQRALSEALVRMWDRRARPALLEEFEVVSVEQEIVMPLTPELGWMARADAVLRRRADGDLYVYSLKTANDWGDRKDEENRLDMQGVSELAAVEHLTGERVMGVKMEFLIKGRRDKRTGWMQDSALVRPWRSMTGGGVQWAWSGSYPCKDPENCSYHRKRPSATPYHNLSSKDGWERVDIWTIMTVEEWVERLASGEIQPEAGDPFATLVVSPIPYYRNRGDVERWRRQATAQEERVAQDATHCNEVLAGGDLGALETALDERFPQYKRSCLWPTKCQYYEQDTMVCMGTGQTLMEPLECGLIRRKPHHDPERDEA